MAFGLFKRFRANADHLEVERGPIVEPVLPVPAVATSGVSSPQAGFMDATDGRSEGLVWARYSGVSPFAAGYAGGWQPFWGTPGSEHSRERALVSSVTSDLLYNNAVIATLVESLATYAVGNGLTLSSRPNAEALNISAEEARALAHQIETAWAAWINNPVECDASGRFTLNQLVVQAFKSYLLNGETLALVEWQQRANEARTGTKLKLLDVRQLAQDITRTADDRGGSIMQGVEFDKSGRLTAYWIRQFELGNFSMAPQAKRIAARTSWGRPRVLLLFDGIVPNQIRGMSPLTAALTPAHAKNTHREFTLAQALVQSMTATTVESDLPRDVAMNALRSNDPTEVPPGASGVAKPTGSWFSPADWMATAGPYYEKVKVALDPGKVVHMLKGDRLVMHRSQSPNSTYDAFDKSLSREAAKAAGASYEDATGDFSNTSFSAARLAQELPWRVNLRRRAAIAERLYQETFTAWLEEAVNVGTIKVPSGAREFWEAPSAYTNAVWRGSAKPVADPLKAAQADILEIENGLATQESKLGERGYDFEEVVAQRKVEKDQLTAAGLPHPVPKNRDDWKPEDDPASK